MSPPARSRSSWAGICPPAATISKGEVIVSGLPGGEPVRYAAKDRLLRRGRSRQLVHSAAVGPGAFGSLLRQGTSSAIRDEIIAMSEEFHIITPYTSLLVLETDADRERFGVKRRYEMRDGERFFAEGKADANFDLRQQQMKRAGDWRLGLRRQVLRELATLGRTTMQQPSGQQPWAYFTSRGPADLDKRELFDHYELSSTNWHSNGRPWGETPKLSLNMNTVFDVENDPRFGVEATLSPLEWNREIVLGGPSGFTIPSFTVPSKEQDTPFDVTRLSPGFLGGSGKYLDTDSSDFQDLLLFQTPIGRELLGQWNRKEKDRIQIIQESEEWLLGYDPPASGGMGGGGQRRTWDVSLTVGLSGPNVFSADLDVPFQRENGMFEFNNEAFRSRARIDQVGVSRSSDAWLNELAPGLAPLAQSRTRFRIRRAGRPSRSRFRSIAANGIARADQWRRRIAADVRQLRRRLESTRGESDRAGPLFARGLDDATPR